jgi:hypothetical protein
MELVERAAPRGRTSIVADLDLRSKRPLREERLREIHTQFPMQDPLASVRPP